MGWRPLSVAITTVQRDVKQTFTVVCNVRGDNRRKLLISYQDGLQYKAPDEAVKGHTVTQSTLLVLVCTWLSDQTVTLSHY